MEPYDAKRGAVLLGSCFSEHISERMDKKGLDVLSNPFGVIFHPAPLSGVLRSALLENGVEEGLMSPVQDRWVYWLAGSRSSRNEKEELRQHLRTQLDTLHQHLSNAGMLVITFGTAWGYRHVEKDVIVGNCFRENQQAFKKEMWSVEQIVEEWKETLSLLGERYPGLRVVFAVSPVRHWKDGPINNSRSKATLVLACAALEKESNATYFPSYEIFMDELRDYRYYREDGLHPNQEGVDVVWERFSSALQLSNL